jgi:hypothetical protein
MGMSIGISVDIDVDAFGRGAYPSHMTIRTLNPGPNMGMNPTGMSARRRMGRNRTAHHFVDLRTILFKVHNPTADVRVGATR